jgi:hypothetical protein
MDDELKVDALINVLGVLKDIYANVDQDTGNGSKVVFSMITTTFNNICDILEVKTTNTNK